MAHFAQIDSNNIVTQVLVVPNEYEHRGHDFLSKDLNFGGTWIQTSYNSFAGKHYTQIPLSATRVRDVSSTYIDPISSIPVAMVRKISAVEIRYKSQLDDKPHMRYNYAGIGYKYDSVRDAFIPPQSFPSWTLDETACVWVAPVQYPTDGGVYTWNESITAWSLVKPASAIRTQSVSGIN